MSRIVCLCRCLVSKEGGTECKFQGEVMATAAVTAYQKVSWPVAVLRATSASGWSCHECEATCSAVPWRIQSSVTHPKQLLKFLGELGFSPQELTARLQQQWALLPGTPERLAALEAMLQWELGANRSLFRKILVTVPRAVNCSLETVQWRAQALVAVSEDVMRCIYHQLTWRELVCCRVASSDQPSCGLTLPCLQEFGWEQALHAVDMAPDLLAVNTGVWRRALAVMRLCGVADPAALALNNARVLCLDWLAPGRLANRLALQRCLGLLPAGVFERHAGYVVRYAAERLEGRLLYGSREDMDCGEHPQPPVLVGCDGASSLF